MSIDKAFRDYINPPIETSRKRLENGLAQKGYEICLCGNLKRIREECWYRACPVELEKQQMNRLSTQKDCI